VVLVHAFPLSAAMWAPQLERAPEGWRVIAPDLRGFGGDAVAAAGLTIEDYANDVLRLMDALAIEEAVIGGLSLGGYVTFAMFRQAPERFTGMVLADTRAAADTAVGREARTRMRETVAREGARGVAEQMLPKLLSGATARERPDVVEAARALMESAPAAAIDAAIVALMQRADATALLETISCATLVLVGDEDTITPVADAEAMQRAIPRSRLTVLAGAGHLSNIDQPDAFSRALGDFLRGAL
jgi:pimeloyl-ACP methyl ester carboxylesterase